MKHAVHVVALASGHSVTVEALEATDEGELVATAVAKWLQDQEDANGVVGRVVAAEIDRAVRGVQR